MAETLTTIKTRRSCRAYKPELIEEEKLNAIIEAGTYAATGMGKQSPIIIAVTDKAMRDKLSKMNAAAEFFAGEHEFAAFCAAGGSQKTTVRRLFGVKVEASGEDPCRIEIEVSGEAFLYNMVRIIAGTLLYVGQGKIEPAEIKDIIDGGDRSQAGKTLPAKGLTLEEVFI